MLLKVSYSQKMHERGNVVLKQQATKHVCNDIGQK